MPLPYQRERWLAHPPSCSLASCCRAARCAARAAAAWSRSRFLFTTLLIVRMQSLKLRGKTSTGGFLGFWAAADASQLEAKAAQPCACTAFRYRSCPPHSGTAVCKALKSWMPAGAMSSPAAAAAAAVLVEAPPSALPPLPGLGAMGRVSSWDCRGPLLSLLCIQSFQEFRWSLARSAAAKEAIASQMRSVQGGNRAQRYGQAKNTKCHFKSKRPHSCAQFDALAFFLAPPAFAAMKRQSSRELQQLFEQAGLQAKQQRHGSTAGKQQSVG